MEKDFGTGNYDFLHGGLGVGYYFLKKRIPSTMNNKVWYLWLKNKAITCTDGCFKWESTLSDSRKKGFNISLSHGMSSIVVCLTKLMEKYPHVVTIKDILSNTIRYILQQRFINPVISHFPSYSIESEENPNPSRLGWCYGDLGIAQSLLQASRALENEEYKKIALNILLDSCKRKSLQENNVMDAGICHGTSGISHIYNRLSKDLNYNIFKEMSIYWMEKTIENDRFKDGLAGYKTWIGKNEWKEQYCLLDGISGIGLSIMAHLKSDFMDWDECLLLN